MTNLGSTSPERTTNLRQIQRESTRQLIIEAAADLFRGQGYATTSIDEIAKAAGTTRTTFYLHFKNKEEVIAELISINQTERAAFNVLLSKAVQQGDRESLRHWLDAAFDFWRRVATISKAEEEAAALHPEVQQARQRGFAGGVDAIVAGLEAANRWDEMGRKVRAVLAYAQLTNLFQRWLRVGWDVDRAEMLEIMTDMWMCAFTTESGSIRDATRVPSAPS